VNSRKGSRSNFEPDTDRRFLLSDPADPVSARVLHDALVSGACASVASVLMLLAWGRREAGDAAAPVNGPSQWIWGRHAPYRDGFSWRYTAVGYLVHHLASTFWALLYELARPGRRGAGPAADVAAALATAAVANAVDFQLTPQRLTPGFQQRLSRRGLLAVYAAFGAGLAAGALLRRR
jgi:hypothetical protein